MSIYSMAPGTTMTSGDRGLQWRHRIDLKHRECQATLLH
jgi:hypothetical protein